MCQTSQFSLGLSGSHQNILSTSERRQYRALLQSNLSEAMSMQAYLAGSQYSPANAMQLASMRGITPELAAIILKLSELQATLPTLQQTSNSAGELALTQQRTLIRRASEMLSATGNGPQNKEINPRLEFRLMPQAATKDNPRFVLGLLSFRDREISEAVNSIRAKNPSAVLTSALSPRQRDLIEDNGLFIFSHFSSGRQVLAIAHDKDHLDGPSPYPVGYHDADLLGAYIAGAETNPAYIALLSCNGLEPGRHLSQVSEKPVVAFDEVIRVTGSGKIRITRRSPEPAFYIFYPDGRQKAIDFKFPDGGLTLEKLDDLIRQNL